ncbi:electron transport complex subunit RsxC [Vibrio hippocampi]|uniref:Ion-translocating oxidoreductase complex subunit C n=1 Tax=Vibrio hippocampi TaxID=654686 RepID=A0ABN8DFD3_9VIBR|nr:electron transport complex subunit RsxC [Vibrio hippocampi]CAH0525520.1 Ion-translocating oxidoreductase complex subunit C [Vibrio hippocampi]
MLSLIEQIQSGLLWDFPGGVHPVENKTQSNQTAIAEAIIPSELVIPIKQHIGKPGDILVSVGDTVLKGQCLTEVNAAMMLPVHASTSGIIVAIEPRTVAHPSGLSELCIVLQPNGQDQWIDKTPIENYQQHTPEQLIEIIRQAGVSGMGGAGFPTAKKIQAGQKRTDVLIINAAECEPYITADDTLMQHFADEIIAGIEVLEHILEPKLTVIGVEDNKPQAIQALQQAAQHLDIVIRVIPTKYPSGGEKQLIKIITNLEVPSGGIPADIGVMVQNVGSVYSVKKAVLDAEPLIQRVVTLTGDTFAQPRNVWTLIGTPVQALLDEYSYQADKKSPRLIMGGPMMGFTLPHANVPITKTSNCILAPTRKEIAPHSYEMPCIRCSQCAEACPASLLPQQLQWYAKSAEYDKCEELNIKDCIECGACAYVCPSEIPLVQYYRQAKAEIRSRNQEAEAAERARLRFEEKKARMERDKQERENRFKQAADARRQQMKASTDGDAVAAAIARVKAKQTSDIASSQPKPAVAAAIARAKAKQAEALASQKAEPDNSEMNKLREERKRLARERKAEKASNEAQESAENGADKSTVVAAAIARAKARKAEQQAGSPQGDEPQADSKKDAVAAAIARAKARKAEQQTASSQSDESQGDSKKDAVAAAIARAKARKAEQQAASSQEDESPEESKKAAVAAAVARAKARKAEQQTASSQSDESPEDNKKAAVAAAVARAKARKAEQQTASSQDHESPKDDKKAAVAAAIARAKAKKAQSKTTNKENE